MCRGVRAESGRSWGGARTVRGVAKGLVGAGPGWPGSGLAPPAAVPVSFGAGLVLGTCWVLGTEVCCSSFMASHTGLSWTKGLLLLRELSHGLICTFFMCLFAFFACINYLTIGKKWVVMFLYFKVVFSLWGSVDQIHALWVFLYFSLHYETSLEIRILEVFIFFWVTKNMSVKAVKMSRHDQGKFIKRMIWSLR